METTRNVQSVQQEQNISHSKTIAGENGLLKRDNTELSTAHKGGKGEGPPQGSNDQYTCYQDTRPLPNTKHQPPPPRPPPTTTRNVLVEPPPQPHTTTTKKLNLNHQATKVKRKWKEIELGSRDKTFKYITVVDYGIVTTTNELRQEKRKNEKKIEKLKVSDERDTLKKLADKMKRNFFKYKEDKTGKAENSPMKRKRDEDKNQSQIDIQETRNVRMKRKEDDQRDESTLKNNNTASNISSDKKSKCNEKNLSEMPGPGGNQQALQVRKKTFKGGKTEEILKFFENFSSKDRANVRGKEHCLASQGGATSNEMFPNRNGASGLSHEMAKDCKTWIGGDSEPRGAWANGGRDDKIL